MKTAILHTVQGVGWSGSLTMCRITAKEQKQIIRALNYVEYLLLDCTISGWRERERLAYLNTFLYLKTAPDLPTEEHTKNSAESDQ